MTAAIHSGVDEGRESISIARGLERANRAEKKGRWEAACGEYERLIRNPEARLDTRLSALRLLGRAYLERGDRGAARDVLEAAVAAAEQARRPAAVARALNVVAILEQTVGNLEEAAALYVLARGQAQAAGDGALVAMIDQNAGTVASIRGDTRGALESFRLSLAGYQSLGMTDYAGQVLNNMGLAFVDLGAHRSAESAYAEAIQSFDAGGDRSKQRDVAVNQVQLWIAMRRFDKARHQCDELLAATGGEKQPWAGEVLRHMGVIARERSEYAASNEFLALAAKLADESEDYLLTADVAEQQAELFWAEERHREMLASLNRARAIYSRLNAMHRVADIERRNANLEQRFLKIARSWGDSIEGADHYTQGHCERVASLACALAVRAGLDPRDMFWFRLGALLHDVGKVIVPPEVLNKAGQLTPDEWDLMKRHPEEGLKLVAGVDFPGDVRSMIRSHHERWDGKGYPDGLAGEATSLPARILCIADVYDALTSPRPYRQALSHDEGMRIMLSADGQFDPGLIPIFTEWATPPSRPN
ncbi:MAG: HD-GYP domain-containing protein [Gemmatimonadaceae bacterium]|nr:HD-GYP domain-containing protein [Gemmatimonadaceae bacterium]